MERRVVVENEAVLSEIQVKLLKLHNFVQLRLALVSDVDGHPVLAAGEIHNSIECVMTASASAYLYLAIVVVILHAQDASDCGPDFSCSIAPCAV